MKKQPQKASDTYKSSSIETVAPGKLILMLYDGAIKFINEAKEAIEKPNSSERNRLINEKITKAHRIMVELRSCLNMSVPGEFAKTMKNLYEYMEDKLMIANAKREEKYLDEVLTTLKDIRDAWAEMLSKLGEGADPNVMTTSLSCTA